MSSRHVPDKISPDLQALVQKRQENDVLLQQYKDLTKRVEGMLKAHESWAGQGQQRMHVDYDLGQGFTVEAVVPDSSKINVVLGTPDKVVAELTLEEALDFAAKRIDLCHRTEEALARQESELRKDLQTVRSKGAFRSDGVDHFSRLMLEQITNAFKQALDRMQAPQAG